MVTRQDTTEDDGMERRESALLPTSYNEKDNTIEVVFATGADVMRVDPWTGERWMERLPLSGLDVSELNLGAHVLAAHDASSLASIIGSVVPDSVKVQKRRASAKIKLSNAPSHAEIVGNIKDGIIRKLSYGYARIGEPVVTKDDGVEVRTWAAHLAKEISFVPVPADGGTGTRSQPEQEVPMPSKEEIAAEATRIAAEKQAEEKRAADIQAARVEGGRIEAQRQADITALGTRLHLPDETWRPMLVAGGPSLDSARLTLLEAVAARADATATHSQIQVGVGEGEKVRAAMADALVFRAHSGKGTPPDASRDFAGMRLAGIARECLRRAGRSHVERLDGAPLFDLAMGYEGGMRAHSTSDFPLILSDAMNKSLRAEIAVEVLNFLPIAKQKNLPDFKTANHYEMGSFTTPQLIPEGAEVKFGTLTEGREQWRLFSYGIGWKHTREMMINDDMDAFSSVPALQVAAMTRLKLDLFWSLITANANMADGVALFAAGHANLAAGGDVGAPSPATLGAMRESFRLQTELGGGRLNLQPSHLIIPANLETTIEQIVTPVAQGGFSPAATNAVVPRFVGSLGVIVEPRLDANSTTHWYAAAASYLSLIYGYLEGAESVQFSSAIDFSTRGIEARIDLDFGCGVTNHRGLYENPV